MMVVVEEKEKELFSRNKLACVREREEEKFERRRERGRNEEERKEL